MAKRNLTRLDRFWSKVEMVPESTCWYWVAGTKLGYGVFWNGTKSEMAHRYAYRALVGEIPAGLVIDHLCRTPLCVNPAHMEPVSIGTNVLRGIGPSALEARQTHCKRGHPLHGENLFVRWNGRRVCISCRRTDSAASQRKYKERVNAYNRKRYRERHSTPTMP